MRTFVVERNQDCGWWSEFPIKFNSVKKIMHSCVICIILKNQFFYKGEVIVIYQMYYQNKEIHRRVRISYFATSTLELS